MHDRALHVCWRRHRTEECEEHTQGDSDRSLQSLSVTDVSCSEMSATLTVHYRRHQRDYQCWRLWLWPDSGQGSCAVLPLVLPPRAAPEDSFGVLFRIPVDAVPWLGDCPRLCIQPHTPGWVERDPLERKLHNFHVHLANAVAQTGSGLHLYIVQGDPNVHLSPRNFRLAELQSQSQSHSSEDLTRFVAITVDTAAAALTALPTEEDLEQSERPWLVVTPEISDVAQNNDVELMAIDIFPAPQRVDALQQSSNAFLFILDRALFPRDAILNCIPVSTHEEAETALEHIDSAAAWHPGDSDAVLLVSGSPIMFPEEEELDVVSVEDKLVAQSEAIPGFCRVISQDCHSSSKISQILTTPEHLCGTNVSSASRPHTLWIHYFPIGGTARAQIGTLSICGARNAAIAPEVTNRSLSSSCSLTFDVELSLFTALELRQGLKITPLQSRSGAPAGPTAVWKPDIHGMSIAFGEGRRHVMKMTDAMLSVHYHRFDNLADWKFWHLHVWCDQSRENSDGSSTVAVAPSRLLADGVVVFELACFAIFSIDASIHMQPVKYRQSSCLHSQNAVSHEGEEPGRDSDSNSKSCLKDLARVFQRSEFISGPSGKSNLTLHIVQASQQVQPNGPSRQTMLQQRYIRLNYRRFLDNDYDGWDLWTWDDDDDDNDDDDDAEHSRTSVVCDEKISVDCPEGLSFVVDRAVYGSGRSICVLPRRGGDAWLAKDEPTRILRQSGLFGDDWRRKVDACDVDHRQTEITPCVLIVQSSELVLRDIDECRSMLSAHVSSDTEVSVHSPVPFEWLMPDAACSSSRPYIVQVPDVTQVATAREALYDLDALNFGDCSMLVKCRTVARLSPTHMRFVSETDGLFDEDFLVENTLVGMRGFEPCQLSWKEYDSCDEFYYPGPLGWEYSRQKCAFRCFAPMASAVFVVLYSAASGGSGKDVSMRRIPEGCWKAVVEDDLKGMYYKLRAEGENKRLFPGVEVIDPYSRCNTGHAGRGLIFGNDTTPIAPRPTIDHAHTIVYELHVRDATIDPASGVQHRGKFLGLTERGTTLQNVPAQRIVENPGLEAPESNSPGSAKSSTRKQPESEHHRDDSSSGQRHNDVDVLSNHTPLSETECSEMGSTPLNNQRHCGICQDGKTGATSTALDHIIEMGVTAVQIMPIQDFDNNESDETDYNWGYMPVHFNSPDGWYASCTTTAARVKEFKQLVDAFHRSGLKVIMDVVYNHTAEDSNEFNLDARFSFNGLAPRYYYRNCSNTPVAHTGDSTCCQPLNSVHCGTCASNGSGCGNEFRSESRMGRKFILDSLKYWANEYQVDGFRFDLLGLIDLETLTLAASELHAIDPNIVLYGEPWCGGLTPIKSTDKGSQRSRGFGVFNNTFRDALRGSPFGIEETFVMDGGRIDEVKRGIMGSIDDFADSPLETINYVECHDNYTLWDHMRFYIRQRTDDISFSEVDMIRMHKLAALIIFTSQGIPMMQIGQEMCRTKFDDENSYKSPDHINMVRWGTKPEKRAVIDYHKGLITLRKSQMDLFSICTADSIRSCIMFYEELSLPVPPRCIAYRVVSSARLPLATDDSFNPISSSADTTTEQSELNKWSSAVVLLNPTPVEVAFDLPGAMQLQHWVLVANEVEAGVAALQQPIYGRTLVSGRSGAVLRQASASETESALLNMRADSVTDAFMVPTDEILSPYAVGLTLSRTLAEQQTHEALVLRKQQFLKTRSK